MSDPTLQVESFLDVDVRLWAELGRAQMPIGRAVGLSEGSVVDLDRHPDEPVDVYVNGMHFGTGRLILADGEWAIQLESVDALGLETGDGLEDVEQASSPSSETA